MKITAEPNKISFQSIRFDAGKSMGIENIESALKDYLSDSKGTMREMCMHILSAGGKRIRPLMVMHSGLVFSDISEQLVNAAVAAELIHMASLVHDDIIDNSFLRRSKLSINKAWGNNFAVLCGDYLFSKAFGIMSKNRLVKSMDLMVEAIENMCSGEIVQAGERFNHEMERERYYEIIGMKTAIFIKCCCKSGAVVSGADKIHTELLGEYGLNIGYAFQIIDDILDFCGKVEDMGKPRCEDFRQGIITLPVIMLKSHPVYREWMVDIISKREITDQDGDEVVAALKATGIIDQCFKTAAFHIEKAKQSLELLPESEHKDFLGKLADIMQARVN